MPWQHYILIAEMIVSALIAGYIRTKVDSYTLTAKVGYPWAVIEAVMVGLLIWGADHFAWQYFIVGLWFTFDCLVNVVHVGNTRDLAKQRKHATGNAFVSALLIVLMFTLLYTGA